MELGHILYWVWSGWVYFVWPVRHLTLTFVFSAFQKYVLHFGHFFQKTGKLGVSRRVKIMTR